jgi:hypothetical protein
LFFAISNLTVVQGVSSSKVGVIREDGHLARLMWDVECGKGNKSREPQRQSITPTGFNNPAQGNALGKAGKIKTTPTGLPNG